MRRTFYRGAAVILVGLVFSMVADLRFLVSAREVQRNDTITMIIRSSPNAGFESRLDIEDSKIIQALRGAKKETIANSPYLTDIYIAVPQVQKTLFRLESSGNLWSEMDGERLVIPRDISDKLLKDARILRSRHYGKLIEWEEAKKLLPRKSFFSIKDLETGLEFRVQRRAGRDHADVQPVTKEDTKIMKQIYNGRWSWKRKAIVLSKDGKHYAASMNGMPHGGDGIPGNNFSGHFCVHFLNSSTHRSAKPDPAHQLMVQKAAGNLRSFFDSASPLLLVQSLIEASNQKDLEMIRMITEGIAREKYDLLIQELSSPLSIKTIKQCEMKINQEGDLFATINLGIGIQQKGRARQKTSLQFIFARQLPHTPWRLQTVYKKKPQHASKR
ncbi:hypothetical protein [Paenibacillus sp. GCM10027626]|uniref:hypothetical protein n=1 Tax=Paenibacillus sp. GCM10027626 TaxID=3273411 RepID=UPI003627E94B